MLSDGEAIFEAIFPAPAYHRIYINAVVGGRGIWYYVRHEVEST